MSQQSTRPSRGLGLWRRSHLARGVATLGVVACVATGTWAVEESAQLGLRGILSTEVPTELAEDQFALLEGNWAEWSKGAAAAVADFYAKLDTADVAGQRAALQVLKNKADVMQRAIDDPRYRSILGPLQILHGRLAQRVELADAVLNTLETDPQQVRSAKLAKVSQPVLQAAAELQTYLSGVPNGRLWVPYTRSDSVQKALRAGSGSEAAISTVREAREKLAGRQSLTDEKQKEFLGRAAFLKYESALSDYLAAADWQPPKVEMSELRTQLKSLMDATDSYLLTRSATDAAAARTAFASLSKVAPDGGDQLSAALQKHFFNYNVRLVVSEEFLNRLMSESRTDRGPVVDSILGAAVSGNQTTLTKVTVDLRPSGDTARFELNLSGNINSNTVGVTPDATVYTQGNHTFLAKKEVNFDGVSFTTRPATINVVPHNTTTGISTRMSGGLLGGIANNIASREVEARRGTAENIAAGRVQQNVLPKFNAEADKNFSEAGAKLEKELFAGLKSTGLFPDAYVYQSTESLMRLNSRLMSATELGADVPSMAAVTGRGASLLLHESAINNSIDRMGLAGQTLTEPQLREKLSAFFSQALSREVKIEPPPKPATDDADAGDADSGPSAIMFDKTDPIRVRLENGELVLVIRAGFKQEGKDDIPPREITAPINFTVKDKRVLITRGAVRVVAAGGEGGGIAINGVVRKKIQAALPDRNADAKVELKGPRNTVAAYIAGIGIADGWIHVVVD